MAGTNRSDRRETVSRTREMHNLQNGDAADLSLTPPASPDTNVRLARIMLLQQAIAAGTYRIPALAVAERMVEGLIRAGKTPAGTPRGDA